MSSKRRRKARAWMQAERERHAEEKYAAVDAAVERLTRRMGSPPDRERFTLVGDAPEHPVVKVLLPVKREHVWPGTIIGSVGAEVVTLRAVLMKWATKDGRGVCWYTWEVCDGNQ